MPAMSEEPATAPVIDTKQDPANGGSDFDEPPSKKAKLENSSETKGQERPLRDSGTAPIKAEYADASISPHAAN